MPFFESLRQLHQLLIATIQMYNSGKFYISLDIVYQPWLPRYCQSIHFYKKEYLNDTDVLFICRRNYTKKKIIAADTNVWHHFHDRNKIQPARVDVDSSSRPHSLPLRCVVQCLGCLTMKKYVLIFFFLYYRTAPSQTVYSTTTVPLCFMVVNQQYSCRYCNIIAKIME